MTLQIVADTPGLWRDPQWQPGMPGVYALIAGASAYPHLKGGSKPAPDTFDMEQLVSSAQTAAALFDWLRQDFQHRDLEVVWCQLLLSPTAGEKARLGGLQHYAPADNETLRKAIQRWTGNVPKAAPAARQSRTLFFFSGHGVMSNWRPLILPSDYLDPGFGAPQLENCISTRELLDWMDQSPVAEHLALIDACQNQFSPLASKGATANTCFPVHPPGGAVPRTAAALASTSPNAVAYQLPGRDHTFFGEAVLEALRGLPAGGDSRLDFRELVDYVKPRVNALLQAAGGTALEQTVRPRIEGDDALVVTEIAPAAPMAAPSLPAAPPSPAPVIARAGPRAARPMRQPVDAALAPRAVRSRFDDALAVRDPIPLAAMRGDVGETHRRMGHEYATYPWTAGMQLIGLKDGQPIAGDDGTMVRAVERNEASSLVQVDLALAAREGGVLLVFEGAQYVQRGRLAVALPTDTDGRVPIRLNLAIGAASPGMQPRILSLEARLGPADDNPHYAYLWELTREADLGSLRQAAQRAQPQRLKNAAQQKMNSQTAAVAGMLLLARAGRIGDVGDWTRNLGLANPVDEMAAALATLDERGAPFFADVLELAESLLRYVLRHPVDAALRERLAGVQERIEQLFQVAMPSGHFIALAGLPRPAFAGQGSEPLGVADLLKLLGR
jgi:hypothetical protein